MGGLQPHTHRLPHPLDLLVLGVRPLRQHFQEIACVSSNLHWSGRYYVPKFMSVCCNSCLLFLLAVFENSMSTQGSRLVHLICFAPLCWWKRGANAPQLAIFTGSCLLSSAEGLWRVDMCTLSMGSVSSRAGCCCRQLDAAWFGGGPKSCQAKPCCHTGSVSGTGQDARGSHHSSNAKSMPS